MLVGGVTTIINNPSSQIGKAYQNLAEFELVE
jgi:hypothetical protein